jgi:hypothetical protein
MNRITNNPSDQNPGAIIPSNTEHRPDEVWNYIFSHFDRLKDIMALGGTNRHLNAICLCPRRCKKLLKSYFPSAFANSFGPFNYTYLYQECALQLSHIKQFDNPSEISSGGNQFCVHGDCQIVSKWATGTIEISDIKTNQLIHTLETGFTLPGKFQVEEGILGIVCFEVAQVWDISTGKRLHEFDVSFIRSADFLRMEGDLFCVGSMLGDISIWEISTGEQIFQSSDAAETIRDLQLCGNLLFVGGSFLKQTEAIQVWDIEEVEIVRTFKTPKGARVKSLNVQENLLVAIHAKTIAIWEIDEAKCLHCIETKASDIHVQGNFLIEVGKQRTKVWDICEGEILHEMLTQESDFPTSLVSGDHLFTFTSRGPVNIWSLSMGEKIGSFPYNRDAFANCTPQADGDFLCIQSRKGAEAKTTSWDLLPHPSVYEAILLGYNLKVLQQMAQNLEECSALLEKLDPPFQWHLKSQCLALTQNTESLCLEGVKRVQIMVHLELLLHAIYDGNEKWVGECFKQLAAMDASLLNFLTNWTVEEHAFKGVEKDARASRRGKIQAVQGLQAELHSKWQ